jgi:predicted dithiol-disulfide oxidoreductase (DUF899 family)
VRAKVRVAPVQAFADRVVRRALDLNSADEVFRPALVAELRERPYEFDIQVQLCTDLAQMPVEKVTVRWPETLSPYVTVAKLRLPQQDIGGEDNLERMDATSMTPWRVTEAHRPLGNIMRARKEAYRQSSIPRHQTIRRVQVQRRIREVHPRRHERHPAAGERCQVWGWVPHDRQGARLRLHGLRAAVNANCPEPEGPRASCRHQAQLLVYHFMFGYGFRLTDERRGCTGCSLIADHFDGVIPHVNGRDITLVCESIAPLKELRGYKRQMGWRFPWVSSLGSDFRYDFGAAFTEEQQRNGADYNYQHVDKAEPQKEGMSVFARQDGAVYHTYSTYARGTEALMGTYRFLDLAPWGRNEDGLKQIWWRRHDEYDKR